MDAIVTSTDNDVREMPRYDVPALWDSKKRRSQLIAKGINPDQMVLVKMTSADTGEIIEHLPYDIHGNPL